MRFIRRKQEKEINKAIKKIVKYKGKEYLRKEAGELKLAIDILRKHSLIVGATGVGKSVLLKRIIRQFLQRQRDCEHNKDSRNRKKIIINDIKGDYIEEFYTDDSEWIIFNVFDTRGYGFEVFELLRYITDIDRVADALIVESAESKSDPIWRNSAKDLFKGIIHLCIRKAEFKNEDILKYINKSYKSLAMYMSYEVDIPNSDKKKRVAYEGCEAAFNHLTSNQAGNLYSNFISYMAFFESFASTENIISVRDYVRSDPRNIIMANFEKIQSKVAPIFSLFIEAVGSEILDLEENPDTEIVMILDEFASLKKMEVIPKLLRLSRSAGALLFIGIQEIPPIEHLYGKAIMSTFLNNTATKIVFNINDDETQEKLSKLFGKQEVEYSTESNSGGETETKSGFSTSQQRRIEYATLGGDFGGLTEHEFFYVQRGISDENKTYIGKIRGQIDPKIDTRDKIAQKVIWREDLALTKVIKAIEENKEKSFDINKKMDEALKLKAEIEAKNKSKKEQLVNQIEQELCVSTNKVEQSEDENEGFI